jgi:hypothetical protein
MRRFVNDDLNWLANNLKERARQIAYVEDESDLGNEIGILIGKRYENLTEEETHNIIHGIQHGISLTNGTH